MNSWLASVGSTQSAKGIIVQHYTVKLIRRSLVYVAYHTVDIVENQADSWASLYLGIH